MPPYLLHVSDQFFNDMWSDGDLGDAWLPISSTPSISPNVCALTIPRPLWIMDGMRDECWASPRDPRAEELYAEARARAQDARDEIARLYALAGAADRLKLSWFEGGHCAGMTVGHAVEWFRERLLA